MDLTLSTINGVLVAQTSGPIDEGCRELFRERLHPHLAESGSKLAVDLSQATRVTSQGLANLVTLAAHANTTSSRVVFCAPSPYLRSVLATTKLDTFLAIAPSLSDALLALSSS
jgi:anti-anti-sigma factor